MEQESINSKTSRICSGIIRRFYWANDNQIWNLVFKVVLKYRDIDFNYQCINHDRTEGELLDIFGNDENISEYWIRFTVSNNIHTMWMHVPYNETKVTKVYERIIDHLNKVGVKEDEQRRFEIRQIVLRACDRSGKNRVFPFVVYSINELDKADSLPIEVSGLACKATLSQEIICEEGIKQDLKIYLPYVDIDPLLTKDIVNTYGFDWNIARLLVIKVKKIMQSRKIVLESAYRNYSQFQDHVYSVGFMTIPNLLSGLQISGAIACIDKRGGKLLVYKQN